MGCRITCFRASVSPIAVNQKNIEERIGRDAEEEALTVKLLLLGTSESGKSTLAKQIRLIHKEGFNDEERKLYISLIHSNTIKAISALLEAMQEERVPLKDKSLEREKDMVLTDIYGIQGGKTALSPELGRSIKRLWDDENLQMIFKSPRRYGLPDSASYYLTAAERISATDYLPDDQDIIRSRVATTGVIETMFKYSCYIFRMYDVGGQRSERRKWIHLFDNVTSIIFTVGMSDYDLTLIEDSSMNRMRESVTLFASIVNSPLFLHTAIILFLNKMDIFEQKLKVSPLKKHLPEFTGDYSVEAATQYIKNLYLTKSTTDREVFTHCTVATDPSNVEVVFKSSMNVVLTNSIKRLGLV